jgi:hypothetical protein
MVTARLARPNGIAELGELSNVLRAGVARLDELPDRDTPGDLGCTFLDPNTG